MAYDKGYYTKNKEKFLQWQREYRKKNRERVLENRRRYDKENHERQLELKRQWKIDNPEQCKRQKKKDDHKYWMTHKDDPEFKLKEKKRHSRYDLTHKKEKAEYNKIRSKIPEVKARQNELTRLRRRASPQSNRSGSIELQIAMNNVRIRDNQTCQWQNCGLTFRQAPIHVHHIFPVNEYPDYDTIEQYMICYCANHHGMFHRYRGDRYANFIGANTLIARGRD